MATRKLTRVKRINRYLHTPSGQRLNHMMPAVAVFAVAAYQSYWHTVEVVVRAGTNGHVEVAYMMPLSVDGMMVVAARYVTHAKTRLGKAMAVVTFILGVSATLAANMMAASPHVFNRIVAVWPAVALVCTAMALHWGEMRPRRRVARKSAVTSPATLTIAA